MAKLKVGDWVEVLDTPNIRTCGNWKKAIGYKFIISLKEIYGEGDHKIYLDKDNKYSINYLQSDLKLLKQKEMAAKKAITKKAPKKGIPAAPIMVELELTDGDYFTADYKKPGSRAGEVKIMGQILDDGCGEYTLCNSLSGYDDETDNLEASSGYGKYINLDLEAGKSVTKQLAAIGITNYRVCSDKRQQAVIEKTKAPEINGYKVRKVGNTYVFGCGSVELTGPQIKVFYKVKQLLTDTELELFTETCNDIRDEMNPEDVDVEEIENLITKMKI